MHRRLTAETKVSWRKTGDQSQTKETKLNTRQETGKLKQEVTKHQTQRQRLDKTHGGGTNTELHINNNREQNQKLRLRNKQKAKRDIKNYIKTTQ